MVSRTCLALVLIAMLAACGGAKSRPSADGAAANLEAGTLHNGSALTIGQGDAAGKGLVLVYFATW